MHGHCTNERRIRKRDKKVRRDAISDDSRAEDVEGAAVMCDGRLFQRRAAEKGTVDRRVRRTSRDAELIRQNVIA